MTLRKLALLALALATFSIGLGAQQAQTSTQAKPATAASTGVSLTGTWTGSFKKMVDGKPDGEDPAMVVLKQDGNVVTGTAGPGPAQQLPFSNGKVATTKDGTTVSFDVVAGPQTVTFEFKLVDGHLKGTANTESNGQKRNAVLDLTKAK